MKLIVAVVHDRDVSRVTEALLRAEVRFTKIGSTGGFLREGNSTILVGVEERRVATVLQALNGSGHAREEYLAVMPTETGLGLALMAEPVKAVVGGAVAFVVDVERFERY